MANRSIRRSITPVISESMANLSAAFLGIDAQLLQSDCPPMLPEPDGRTPSTLAPRPATNR